MAGLGLNTDSVVWFTKKPERAKGFLTPVHFQRLSQCVHCLTSKVNTWLTRTFVSLAFGGCGDVETFVLEGHDENVD